MTALLRSGSAIIGDGETPAARHATLYCPLALPDDCEVDRFIESVGDALVHPDVAASASRLVTEIGNAAGVVVKRYPDGKPDKYASAHDLRRSFGQRWAAILMPANLQELMRHKSIVTTMRYYATGDVHALAQSVWAGTKKAG